MTRDRWRWCVSLREIMKEPETERSEQITGSEPSAEHARAALIVRLDQLCRKPVKPPKSLQPTPEAAKSKIRRLRRKRRLLNQRTRTNLP